MCLLDVCNRLFCVLPAVSCFILIFASACVMQLFIAFRSFISIFFRPVSCFIYCVLSVIIVCRGCLLLAVADHFYMYSLYCTLAATAWMLNISFLPPVASICLFCTAAVHCNMLFVLSYLMLIESSCLIMQSQELFIASSCFSYPTSCFCIRLFVLPAVYCRPLYLKAVYRGQ